MNLQKLLFSTASTVAFGSLALLTACSAAKTDDPQPPGTTGGGSCKDIDYTVYASMPTVSLRNDVFPIFGAACTASDCHKAPEKKADLYLGVRCQTDPQTKICSFPAQEDPNSTSSNPPKPLTDQVYNDVYDSLMANSTTTPSHKRVIPGDPEGSFLVQKCAGVESDQNYTDCKNQDATHTTNPVPCGASMPLNSPALCVGTSRARFDKLAAWVAQGAQKN